MKITDNIKSELANVFTLENLCCYLLSQLVDFTGNPQHLDILWRVNCW